MVGKLPEKNEQGLRTFVPAGDRFMTWAEESIHGTVGGGYGQGGFPPGYWNDGAYGVTTRVPGNDTHYLHVLIPPSGNRLILPDAGYDVRQAFDLKTGRPLRFEQAGGRLAVDVPSWEATAVDGDTVIKLVVAPSRRVVPPSLLSASASSELPYRPAANVLDGKYHTYFRGATARVWPQHLTLRLAEPCEIAGLCVIQPETGAVAPGGYAAPVSERIKAYEVHVSDDGVRWSGPVASGELRNQRGMQVILFRPVAASFVRLTAYGNYAGTGTFQIIGVELLAP
jgi:alpha-L-fucosidase